ncbi:MAG: hypothetical protein M1117_00290, partial [Candidatus Thermoplasmatota archaeon]|nr:hypothetical protein [Candidatus Thermoplasmatota archaeon]
VSVRVFCHFAHVCIMTVSDFIGPKFSRVHEAPSAGSFANGRKKSLFLPNPLPGQELSVWPDAFARTLVSGWKRRFVPA